MKLILFFACSAAVSVAQSPNPLTEAVLGRYHTIRQNLIETAQVMPEEFYSFRLTPAQRPFGEWIAHTALGNYNFCSLIKGEKAPDTAHLHHVAGKAELSRALKESFEYCDAALKDMTDQKALSGTSVGSHQVYPVQGMIALVSSGNEHYGNLVGYLRSKGITPPSSARALKAKPH